MKRIKKSMLQKEQKLQKILELEKKLEEIQDIDVLLERILTETRAIVRADAGSIYEIEDNKLRIKYAQNDTQLKKLKPGEKLPYLSFSVPINEKSISGYVALSGEPVNIQNAYRIPSDKPFVFNKKTDIATGYHTKSIYTLPLKMQSGKLLGVMQLINAQNESGKIIGFDRDAVLYITHFASNVRQALQNTYQTNLMVQRMLKMAELRDPKETYPHVMRVAENSLEIYDRWAFDHRVPEHEKHRFRDCLKIAAKFHDIGKVGIPDAVLHSPKRYGPDDENRAILKGHTCIGAQIFGDGTSMLDSMCRDVALHHHEAWNKSPAGYPGDIDYRAYKIGEPIPPAKALGGDEIPLAARIISVADVFDALSHRRSYKDAWSPDEAFAEIEKGAGTQFDPEIVEAFLQVKSRIAAILLAYPDEESRPEEKSTSV